MNKHFSRARRFGAAAVLLGLLAGCGGGSGGSDPAPTVPTPEVPTIPVTPQPPVTPEPPVTPQPPVTPGTPTPGVATVAISHDGQGSTPPTRVTATFSVKLTSVLPGLITIGGSCTTPPVPAIAQQADGLSLTVTMGGSFRCDPGQTLTVSVDPSKLQFDGATLADTSVWTRSWTMAMLPQQIGGNISGLAGRLVMQLNGADTLASLGDGTFIFPTPVAYGAPYAVTVNTQPQGQTCTVNNGTGTVGTVAVRNVGIVCSTNTYAVGVNVSGLVGSVTLRFNGASPRTITSNGAFSFTPALAQGSPYAVTVATQPASQTCTVSNGTGTVTGPVTNVQVACSANAYTVGGTITGLTGSVVLQNNGGDSLSSSANSNFTFATPVAMGSPYNVTVLTQPAGQICTVTNGSGMMGSSNVTNLGVTCANDMTTISVSPSVMIVPVGGSSTVTLTNSGSVDARDLGIPQFPSGWSLTGRSTCPAALAPGASCNVTIDLTNAYVAGVMQIQFSNTNRVSVTMASSLSGQLVYGIKSPGVALVASEESGSSLRWSDTYVATNAVSETDGAANTTAILAAPGSNDAANYCRAQSTGGVVWSLPALCELTGCGGVTSIKANIHDKGVRASNSLLWSSTEASAARAVATSIVTGGYGLVLKDNSVKAVCVAEHPY